MMDPYIAAYAENARAAARIVLGWHLDTLRLHAGLVEVVEKDTIDIDRPLRRKRIGCEFHGTRGPDCGPSCTVTNEWAGETPARFVPLGNGRGILVRDVAPSP